MALITSIFFGFVPMLLFAAFVNWLDRYEKEPKILLGVVFTWGAVVAAGGAFIVNTLLGLGVYAVTGSEGAVEFSTGSIFAPFIEESLKGFAVLVVFLVFRKEFDSVLDGIVYAAIAALGFAATENAYYIYQYGYLEEGWSGLWSLVFIRVILVGWQHPFYTAFIGIGLALARLNRSIFIKITAPIAGYAASIITHSFHNTLATFMMGLGGLVLGSFFDWTGWFIMFAFIIWMVLAERYLLKTHLLEEVELGNITKSQYNTAYSLIGPGFARIQAMSKGKLRNTNRFYQQCGELAHKKRQLTKLGNEGRNTNIIEQIRTELLDLSAQID